MKMDTDIQMYVCCGLIILLLIVVLVNYEQNRKDLEKKTKESRLAYEEALAELKSDPTNPEIKQQALELGRLYSGFTRKNRAVTVYDEVAILNDINAASAGAISIDQDVQDNNAISVEERLEKLSDLRNKGLISEQEYENRRNKILDEI
jgi:hypothetical protein